MSGAQREAVITFSILGTILIALVVFVLYQRLSNTELPPVSSAAEALATQPGQTPYTDLVGNPIDITPTGNELVVATSWASWCPPCVGELTKLDALAGEYRDQPVVFLAINRSDQPQVARAFLRSIGFAGSIKLVLDDDDRYFRVIGGYNMPETVIYDRQGNLLHQSKGSFDADEVRVRLNSELEKIAEET